ncbi:PAQR family membrane homeostasis protein TrhA [Halovulum sp. GXIMD14793]
MRQILQPRPSYTRAERVSDATIHIMGVVMAVGAVPVLIVMTSMWRGDAASITGAAIYGFCLIAMVLCSALYHMIPKAEWKDILQRLDHSAIYFKIAGTYTPFTLMSGHGLVLLAGLWSAAFLGTGLRVMAPGRYRWLHLFLCVAMGWAGLFAGWSIFAAMSTPVLGLVMAGGITYTVGTLFYAAAGMPFHNTIWHVFVLAATIVFFVAVMLHAADTSTMLVATG